jgi:UDP-glucose 4-epimerase
LDLKGKRLLVVGGAGFVGSHIIDQLIETDVKEIVIYDNFFRGSMDNIKEAIKDPRVSIFPHGGNVLHADILEKAMEDIDGVFHFAALWILQCHEYLETAFEVNVKGTFNVSDGSAQEGRKTSGIFFISLSVWRCP